MSFCEFEASLVDIKSSRSARATEPDSSQGENVKSFLELHGEVTGYPELSGDSVSESQRKKI